MERGSGIHKKGKWIRDEKLVGVGVNKRRKSSETVRLQRPVVYYESMNRDPTVKDKTFI